MSVQNEYLNKHSTHSAVHLANIIPAHPIRSLFIPGANMIHLSPMSRTKQTALVNEASRAEMRTISMALMQFPINPDFKLDGDSMCLTSTSS